jgi:DNA-binding transcriptional LysR family regulator
MNNGAGLDKLEAMRVFAQVVTHGGFSAAAREIGMSRSAVSKHVMDLEAVLGVQLLHRTTRQTSTTDAGLAYFERCKAILAEIDEAELSVSNAQQVPRGQLRINAPMTFGTMHLGSAIADFMRRYADVQVYLVLDDRFVDPIAEGFDITIRIAALEDSSLIARRIMPARRVLCASPGYLRERGAPKTPDDLRRHDCLHYGNLATGAQWKLVGPDGDHWVPVKAVLCANNGEVLRDAALRGLGIALLPVFIVGKELEEGRLVAVMADYEPPPVAVYALYPPSRYLSAKVRVFLDFLVARFAEARFRDIAG